MRKTLIASIAFCALQVLSSACRASSDPEISGENHGGEPVVVVTDDSVNAGLEDWREKNRRAAEEERRRIEEHNRRVRELRQWLADRKPIHDRLKNDIQRLEHEAEAIKASNAERHQQLQAEISRSSEEVARFNEESASVKDELAQKLRDYEQLRGSIPWGSGEGSDQAKFDKAASDFTSHRDYTFATGASTPEGQKLAQALAYRNWAADQLDPSANGFSKKAFAVSAADKTLDIADSSYQQGETTEGDFAVDAAKSMLDLALGLTPGVSWGKDIFEAVTGKNVVTGHDLDMFERSMAVLGAATVGVGSSIGKAVKALNVFKKLEVAGGALKARGFRKSIEEAQKLLHGAPHIKHSATMLRNSPGTATISRPLHDTAQMMRGSHGNAGLVPEIIGKRLEGREFKEFKYYREAFWAEVANSKYAAEFSPQSLGRMKKGRAPFVAESQIHQGRDVLELHHIHPINQGGSVYDSSNIMITTPRFHSEVLAREYHGIK